MKIYLITFLLLCFTYSVSLSQSRININQIGSGNKATITQGDNSAEIETANECMQKLSCPKRESDTNIILFKKQKDKDSTLIRFERTKRNTVSGILLNGRSTLTASQYGRTNTFHLLMPDLPASSSQLKTVQNGFKNLIWVGLKDSANEINLSQKGNNNIITIASCGE